MKLTIQALIDVLQSQSNLDMPVFLKVYGQLEFLEVEDIRVAQTIGADGDDYDCLVIG